MKLPPTKKILREDVKAAPSWINGIIDPINSFMENVYQAMNGNITFNQNINSFVKEISYITTASYPVVDQVSFMNDLKVKATGLIVLQAYDKATYVPAPGPVYAPWVEDTGKILIGAVTGLEISKTYLIRFLVI